MRHAHVGERGDRGEAGGDVRAGRDQEPAGAADEPGRQANLLGALSLTVADRLRAAAERGAGQSGSAPAALVSLAGYLDGRPIDALRAPLGLSHSAAVRVVDRLVQAGLARRRPGSDRRSVAVELTAAGHRAGARAVAARRQALEQALSALDPEERTELMRLHEKLLMALTDGRVTAGNTCRLCDIHTCGHKQGRCPVTRGADAAEATTS